MVTKLMASLAVALAALISPVICLWLGPTLKDQLSVGHPRSVIDEPLDVVVEMPGKIVLAGGTFMDEFGAEVVRLAGGEQAHMVLIPTAYGPTEAEGVEQFYEQWRQWKPGKITVLHTRERRVANDPNFVQPLKTATGVWFLGGVQSRLTDTYCGTLLLKEVEGVFRRGGVVGGNCAGAMALGETMILGNDDEEDEVRLGPGLGIVPKMVADSHYLERNRIERLRGVIESHPDHFGLGIDARTAVIIENGQMRCLGESYAATIVPRDDARDMRFDVWGEGDQIVLAELFRPH